MAAVDPVRYRSPEEDSARWRDFPFRPGDIVISTRSKSGTTWLQTICALLVFQTSELPAPLAELSPWLDWLVTPREEVVARLETQAHRRFVKTHTPLDGIPLTTDATYVVAARHPLDMAVSLYHQGDNLDRERLRRLTGPDGTAGMRVQAPPRSTKPVRPCASRRTGTCSRPRGGRWRSRAGGDEGRSGSPGEGSRSGGSTSPPSACASHASWWPTMASVTAAGSTSSTSTTAFPPGHRSR